MLNFEMNMLDIEVVRICSEFLRNEYERSLKEFNNIIDSLKVIISFEEPEQESTTCDVCYGETFMYWGLCTNCKVSKETGFIRSLCLSCFWLHYKKCDKTE